MPIIVTVAVLQFFAIYGDFVIARVMLRSTDNLTVMVGLLLFQTQRFEAGLGHHHRRRGPAPRCRCCCCTSPSSGSSSAA